MDLNMKKYFIKNSKLLGKIHGMKNLNEELAV
jgi:hypothetical protein